MPTPHTFPTHPTTLREHQTPHYKWGENVVPQGRRRPILARQDAPGHIAHRDIPCNQPVRAKGLCTGHSSSDRDLGERPRA